MTSAKKLRIFIRETNVSEKIENSLIGRPKNQSNLSSFYKSIELVTSADKFKHFGQHFLNKSIKY